ncbi:MAG: peptide/nickel transport system substrate-binding protein [Chloroflexota bacterium]|jgi:peptide/nickel transport system substrate-binding protein|nr:peptide/nickel transport system substrate-binding protein [Chloroflexota bacterium]
MALRSLVGLVVIVSVIAGCASSSTPGAQSPSASGQQASGAQPRTVKRIVAAIRSTPVSLIQQKTQSQVGKVQGLDAIEEMVNAGLTHRDDRGAVRKQLAEDVPTVDNGNWKLFPDGTMQTTWKIAATAKWHDGAPVTADDFRFGMTVDHDNEIGIPLNPVYNLIDHIDTPDARTITVFWKQPFIEADSMFSYLLAGMPIPAHVAEQAYNDDPLAFAGSSFWTGGFVGAGPYKMTDWQIDNLVILDANDDYVLGRPHIDQLEIHFIPDPTTLMANVLAGTDMSLGRALSVDQAVQLGEQWPTGRISTRPYGWLPIHTQFVNPNPPIITELRFRRAMLQAIDRDQLIDTLFHGQATVNDSFVPPGAPEYDAIKANITHYQYEPRAATQALQDLGYTRRGDGSLVDASGQQLSVTINTTTQNDIHPRATAAVSDYWQQLGIAVEQNLIPPQRAGDREYRATFASYELVESNIDLTSRSMNRFRSTSIPLPENRFTATGNNPRYSNPDVDTAVQQYLTTIPFPARMEALGRLVRIQTDQIPSMVLANTVTPNVVANRIEGVTGTSTYSTEAWNVETWDLK